VAATKTSSFSLSRPQSHRPAGRPHFDDAGEAISASTAKRIAVDKRAIAARAIAKTEAYAVSCRQRKKVEMLFAHLKRILGLDRLRLRGPSGAKDEFLLAATAQNPRKLAKLISRSGADLRHIGRRGSTRPH
jgi:hypothetical protein